MKRLTIAVLTMGAIISAVGPAAAQGIYLDLGGPGPRYRDYDEPRYYRRDYDEPRYYRGGTWRGWVLSARPV